VKLTPALGVPAFALAASRARATGLTAVLAVAATQARAQEAPARDTLQLGDVQARTLEADPRAAQFELLQRQSALRVQNVNAERLPSLSVEGQAQYQSDVARIPIALPGGVSVPTPPHDTYDARVAATQRLLDATMGGRRGV
jgi:hypothetical protein